MANVLIVGNGFDRAHDLPTNYSDYLKQLNKDSDFYKYIKSKDVIQQVQNLNKLIDGKVCNYLVMRMGENKGWIDFENELKDIVDEMSNIKKNFVSKLNLTTKKHYYLIEDTNLENIPIFILKYIFQNGRKKLEWKPEEIEKLTNEVQENINLFICFFEEYLIWIFDRKEDILPISFFQKLDVDYLLSFNYTSTYENIYSNGYRGKKILYDTECCHVHGEINNGYKIVMGIGSEFYDENIHEEYVEFFKFYQRYKYETDYKYQEWLKQLDHESTWIHDNEKTNTHIVTIYGHSLDPTDKDIILPFLSLKKVMVNIYYLGEKNKLRIEKNLLKILGRRLFEEYLIGSKKRINLLNCENIK
ncbi:MAG: AbiH family protein [Faecalibacillus sp.]